MEWNDNEMDILNKYLFLTAKPMIYLLNMAKKDYIKKKSKWLMPIKKKVTDFLPFVGRNSCRTHWPNINLYSQVMT